MTLDETLVNVSHAQSTSEYHYGNQGFLWEKAANPENILYFLFQHVIIPYFVPSRISINNGTYVQNTKILNGTS